MEYRIKIRFNNLSNKKGHATTKLYNIRCFTIACAINACSAIHFPFDNVDEIRNGNHGMHHGYLGHSALPIAKLAEEISRSASLRRAAEASFRFLKDATTCVGFANFWITVRALLIGGDEKKVQSHVRRLGKFDTFSNRIKTRRRKFLGVTTTFTTRADDV